MRLPRQLGPILALLCLLTACGSGSGGGNTQNGSTGTPAPLTEQTAAFPYGDPLCMALSPDQKLAFVGQGSALALIELGSNTPTDNFCLKARLPIDVACFSLLPVGQSVFLCAGKLGLTELVTCPGLSDSCSSECPSFPLIPIDVVDHKLCIAAAAVHGHSAGDLLLALYSAEDDTELRVYDLAAPHALRGVANVQGGRDSRGFALIADPSDPNRAYAALGSGGLVRLDIGSLDHIAVEPGPIFDQPDQLQYGQPSRALDLAVAGGFLYAAIDRGGLVEVDLAAPWSASMSHVDQALGCGPSTAAWAYRVSALADETGRILVAVGTHNGPAQKIDGGPFSLVGSWDFLLTPGNVPDPQPGDPGGCDPALFLFEHLPATPGQVGACTPGALCPIASLTASTSPWRALSLRRQGGNYQVCECRRDVFRLMDLGPDPFASDALSYQLLGSQTSLGLAPVGGVASSVDSGLLFLTNDAAGSEFAGMLDIGTGNVVPTIVPNTSSLCAQPTGSQAYCDTQAPALDVPVPFKDGLFSTAHWIDPTDPTREWFVAGEQAVYEQCSSPCSYSDQWCQSLWQAPNGLQPPKPGWKILSFLPGTHDGAQWQLSWWQLPSPPNADLNAGRNYIGSLSDPRPDSPLLHLTRSGISDGYLVCDRNDLMSNAESMCSENNGRGQKVGLHFTHVLSTHLEFADISDGCAPPEALALTTAVRVFSVDVAGTTHWVAALSAGYPANPCASSVWQPYFQRAMVVFYDVTNVDADTPPTLLRMAFGPAGSQGNAFAVSTQEMSGRTYAFVADVGGSLLEFDVSGDVLYPAPSNPSSPTTGLLPSAVWTCPPNSFDGFRDNVVDVVIDLPYAYLATGRRGVTILDVASNPGLPHEIEASPLRTPGQALGLMLHKVGSSTTLVVSDSRAGLRVYGRPPS